MKALICVNNSLRYCPYVNFYIELCRKNNIDFCVLYPDRGNLKEIFDFPTIRYNWNSQRNKAIQLLKYRTFALRIINDKRYDFVMVLTTGAAVLLSNALIKKHRHYLVDIRDYTRENNWVYYQIEKRVIKEADCVVISSPFFRKFLPQREYIDIFNYSKSEVVEYFSKKTTTPIVIAYIGTIAYPNQCEKLMKLVEKDDRFRFYIFGNDLNCNRIENYIKEKRIKNSKYFGPYSPTQKANIIRDVDILFNAYGNGTPLLKYALSNKLTDAAVHKKVVLNSPGTCMNDVLGYCSYPIDLGEETSLHGLYNWYVKLETEIVQSHLQRLLEKIISTNQNAEFKLSKLLTKFDLDAYSSY